ILGCCSIYYQRYILIIQAKALSTKKVGTGEINEFSGVMATYPENAPLLGIFVVKNRDGYSNNARRIAARSSFDILLTNIEDVEQDILQYVFKRGNPLYKKIDIQART